MVKASALRLIDVTHDNDVKGLFQLVGKKQNMVIKSYNDTELLPKSVENLAIGLLEHDDIMKDVINELRAAYVSKREGFRISLNGKSKAEKQIIIKLLTDMYGIVSTMHYNQESEIISGRLVYSAKAQLFINGQYLEIAIYVKAKEVVGKLAMEYNKQFKIYRNVKVATNEARLKNEFDLVIDLSSTLYVIEIKSGKKFREYDKYTRIGREYNIVPDRILLIDNYLGDTHIETIEYFCDYYVSNLSGDVLKRKIERMIINDLEGGNGHDK